MKLPVNPMCCSADGISSRAILCRTPYSRSVVFSRPLVQGFQFKHFVKGLRGFLWSSEVASHVVDRAEDGR